MLAKIGERSEQNSQLFFVLLDCLVERSRYAAEQYVNYRPYSITALSL